MHLMSINLFAKTDVLAYVCVWYRACDYEARVLESEYSMKVE